MAGNNRIYYAIQQVAIGTNSGSDMEAIHGVQSVGITTTFNLEQTFELGQLAIYENIEGVPDVEVTMSKVLDGYKPIYCATTKDQSEISDTGPQLEKRVQGKCRVQLGIWDEANNAAGGAPSYWVEMSGLQVSSVGYNFPLDDYFTEDVTLVGNYKAWGAGATNTAGGAITYTPGSIAGGFSGNSDTPSGEFGVARREQLWIGGSTFPTEIGTVNNFQVEGGRTDTNLASITVSCDIGREDIFRLGMKRPYAKTVTFPVEVTCDFEVTANRGDMINAIDKSTVECSGYKNTSEQTIAIATCEGLGLDLGTKNRLASVSYGGGDAGGGNATVTYSYQTFNDFTVLHSADTTMSSDPSGASAGRIPSLKGG